MTLQDFIQRIEAYYGVKYSAGQVPYIRTYLADRTDGALNFLFAETLKSFPSQYGRCPDIAIFDKLRGDIQDRLEQAPDLSVPEITEDAGNEIDVSGTVSELEKWLEERGR